MMGSPRAVRLILLGSVCLMFCLPGCKRQHAAKDTPDDNELETGSGLDSDTVQETDTGSTAVDTSNMDTSSTAVDTLDDETDSESAVDCSAIDEICNGGDDNCNGLVDEGCDCLNGSTAVCGSAIGECELGVQACMNGKWGVCEGGSIPAQEQCNGLDDNCDGVTDNDCECIDGTSSACGSFVGVCEPGTRICMDGAWGPCEGGVQVSDEVCNGLDDDCDSAVDEGFGVGELCDGDDIDECLDDVVTCDGCSSGDDDWEICNNLDDDCDGVTDEECEEGGPSCIGNGCTCVGDTCDCEGGGCVLVCSSEFEQCLCNDGGCDMTCTDGSYCRCDTEACTIACTSGARCESYSYASSVGSCLGEGTYCCGSGGFSDEKADFQIYCPEE